MNSPSHSRLQDPRDRHSRPAPGDGAMAAAFLAALTRRVQQANPTGKVALPTGVAEAAEVAKVLCALDRTHAPGLPESSDRYPALRLNARWRVIVGRDRVQWILQGRNCTGAEGAETVAGGDWRGRSYCRTRDALLRCCDDYCGEIDPAALAALRRLPDRV